MTQLPPSSQASLLRRLRRQCPFVVWSGHYGYTCGGTTGGVRASTAIGARSKEARHCSLSCIELRKAAFARGISITLSPRTLNKL